MQSRYFQGFRTRLALLVFSAVLPALVLVLYMGFQQKRTAANQARGEALRLVRLASTSQTQIVEGTRQLLTTLAHVPQIRDGNPATCGSVLPDLLKKNPLYANLAVIGPDGTTLCSAVPMSGAVNSSDRLWFQRAVQTQDFAIGGFQIGRVTGKPSLGFAYPVFDSTGHLEVMVYAAIDLGWWSDFGSDMKLPEGAVLTIIDGGGTVLARWPEPEQWVGKQGAGAGIIRAMLDQRQGTTEARGVDGVSRLYAFASLGETQDSGLYVNIGISQATAFAEARRSLSLALMALGIVAALALLATWLGGELFFMSRVRALIRTANQLRDGDLSARTGLPRGRGELQQLGAAFDDMASTLQARQLETTQASMGLLESETRFRAFMDHSPTVAFMKDEAGRFVYLNQPFLKRFDTTEEALLGKADADWLPPDTARALREHDLAVLAGHEAHEVRETVTTPDGVKRSWLVFKFPINDPTGQRFIGGIALDITEKERLERQLLQAQKMEAIGRLAGGVAHDYNNILTVIMGYCQLLLRKTTLDAATHSDIEEINQAAGRAAHLTRQLLAFSRQQVVKPRVFDSNTVVADIEKMLRRLIGEDVQLQVHLKATEGRLNGDPGQLEQIIMNLAVNARDAMPQGGTLILETASVDLAESDVASRPGLKPGPYLVLSVSDTGTGMNEATRARIFEPFFTTKEIGKGTGLGLATVFGIVKQWDGDIQVYSEPGEGTSFRIYLPRMSDASTPDLSPVVTEECPRGTETILLVEDEVAVRSLTRTILESLGYKVLVARHGPEALSLLDHHQGSVDLLLTDVVMPQMSGPQLAQRLRQDHPAMHVLYMSGYAEQAVLRQVAMDSQAGFLQKPFGQQVLAQKVREVLTMRLQQAA